MATVIGELPSSMCTCKGVFQFVRMPGWMQPVEDDDDFMLLLVGKGILPISVDSHQMRIGPGGVVLIPPQAHVEGTAYITDQLTYFGVRFALRDWRRSDSDARILPDGQETDHFVLPLYEADINTDRMTVMMNQLRDIHSAHESGRSMYCDCFIAALLMEFAFQSRKEGEDAESLDHVVLQRVSEWIQANAFADISVTDIAEQFHYSPGWLSTVYKQEFGVGINAQIADIRIKRAEELLMSTSMSVAQVAETVGFNDAKYFMRVFKQRTGLTPTRYRTSFPVRRYRAR